MAPSHTPGSFERFEATRDRLATSPRVSRLERWTSPHTHPGGSVTRMVAVKLRVLVLFLLRRLSQGGGRRRALQGLRALESSALGKQVLVIGSGPSAQALDSAAVAQQQENGQLVVVATNHFLASDLAHTITPDFLVWSDEGFHPSQKTPGDTRWERLANSPRTTLVCPWTWRAPLERAGWDPPVVFFDDDSLETWSRNISPLKPRGYQGTTGVKALAVAVHLGADQVQLIGVDLSYHTGFTVGANNSVTRHPTHLAGTDSGQQDLTGYTLLGMADLLYSTANHFRALHTHFSPHPIVNLDSASLVDAFPKATSSPLVKKPSAS
jgi:hypothetical protein